MSRRYVTLVCASLLLVALACVAFLLPVPYVTLKPGPTLDTLGKYHGKPIIEFGKDVKTYDTSGSLSLTTVSVTRADSRLSLAQAFAAYFDPDDAIVPRDLIYPEGQSAGQAEQETTAQMAGSKETSEAAALRAAGYKVSSVVVASGVLEDGPAAKVVNAGDRILEVNGTTVRATTQVIDAVGSLKPGTGVEFLIERGGKERTVTVKTARNPDDTRRSRVGITLTENFDFPFKVTNNVGSRIGGPSAGSMFALAIYDKLTPGKLTDGKQIAGTGEIAGDGAVLPIGGIHQKIAGAAGANAKIFLVPSDNCAEASRGDDFGLTLLEVGTLEEAVSSLEAVTDDPDAKVPRCN